MDEPWTAQSLEQLRRLAVTRVLEGDSVEDVARILGISQRSVWRWLAAWRREGDAGLAAHPGRGRPSKLGAAQAEQVFAWIDRRPSEFGFPTERWTAPRLAWLIEQRLGVRMNHRYLNDWLRRHGITPQMPGRQAIERDEQLIGGWIAHQWPRIKKRAAT